MGSIRILDLTDMQCRLCSKLLADLGATVIRHENPGANLRKTTAPILYRSLKKPGTVLRLQDRKVKVSFCRLICETDVFVESFRPGYLKSLGLDYQCLHKMNPLLIHLSISGFGQSGPKNGYHACDSVLAAFGGQMQVTGASSGKPLKLYGPQSYNAAALFGVTAVVLNLRRRRLTGKGCHIDLSVQEAVASTLDSVWTRYLHDEIIAGGQQDDYQREPFSTLCCKDGFIQIPILRNWETLLELTQSEGRSGGLPENKWRERMYRENHCSQLISEVEQWTKVHTKRELFELGQAMGFPWAPVQSPEEVLRSRQLKARRFFISTGTGKKRSWVPGLPFKLTSPAPSPQMRGNRDRRIAGCLMADEKASGHPAKGGDILRGIRVLDLSRMISGPYATRILADFGAEVIKIQSRLTATGAEQNDTPAFRAWNRNKRSIRLNLNESQARELFMELVSMSDVVVENYSPRVMANWGLTYEDLKAAKPDLVMASISAMGQTGPWKNYVGYAPTFHALSGLTNATCRSLDMPTDIGYAFGDIIAGLYAALAVLASLEYRDRTGLGQYIDLSAYEASCALLGPAFADASMRSRGNTRIHLYDDCGGAAPCGCYPCKGGNRWCVIAVPDEAAWRALCAISGCREWSSPRFSTLETRRRNRSELDMLISRWTVRYSARTIVCRLQKAGVAAGIVQNAKDLSKDSQLAARRFFTLLHHPQFGESISDRSALWPWQEEPEHWKAAPSFGQDNYYAFVELLGYSEQDFHSFIEKGIID